MEVDLKIPTSGGSMNNMLKFLTEFRTYNICIKVNFKSDGPVGGSMLRFLYPLGSPYTALRYKNATLIFDFMGLNYSGTFAIDCKWLAGCGPVFIQNSRCPSGSWFPGLNTSAAYGVITISSDKTRANYLLIQFDDAGIGTAEYCTK